MRKGRSQQAKQWQLLILLMACIVLFVTTIGMLGPLLVDLATTFRVSIAQAGQLATITAFPWALTSLITGWLSDRYGRKPLLSISLLGIGVCSTLAALAPNFGTLALLRILTGMVGGAGPVTLMATVGDHFSPIERGRAMGWINAGFGIATVAVIPLAGAIAGAWGWRWSFLAVGGAAFSLTGGVWYWLPPTEPHLRPVRSILTSYRSAFAIPRLGYLLGANILERIVFAGVTFYLAAFLIETYQLSTLTVAPFLTMVALGTIIGNLVGGWLADHLSRPLLFMVAQAVTGCLGLLLFSGPSRLASAAITGIGLSYASATSRPGFMAMAIGLSEHHRGTALGFFTFTNQIGWTLGAAVGGLTIAWRGYRALGWLLLLITIAAIGLILPLVITGRMARSSVKT